MVVEDIVLIVLVIALVILLAVVRAELVEDIKEIYLLILGNILIIKSGKHISKFLLFFNLY